MVYGIGNPLIDIFVTVKDEELHSLGLHKGTMHLIDLQRREELLEFIDGKELSYGCGGSCPNTMVALSSFGISSALAGKVCKDRFGGIYRKQLDEIGVKNYLKNGSEPTGSSIILITPDSERTMNTFLGANRQFGPEDIDVAAIEEAEYFHFTGYMWDTEPQKAAILRGIDIARSAGTRVVFDVADPFAVSRNRDTFLTLIKEKVDILFANSEEARILFDHYDPFACARSLGKFVPLGVVKNGKQGSFVAVGRSRTAGASGGREGRPVGQQWEQPDIISIPVKGKAPVDTTGAGDMYAAGFLYGLCRGMGLEEAGLIASFLAGEIVQRRGAQFDLDYALLLQGRLENTPPKELT